MKRAASWLSAALRIAAMLVAGCATVQPYQPTPISRTHKVERNYEIGREQAAVVGWPIVRVKEYDVIRSPTGVVEADRSFTLYTPPVQIIRFPSGGTARIVGTTPRAGIEYRLLRLPQSPSVSFLLNADGTFEGSAVDYRGDRMGWSYWPTPSDVHFIAHSTEAVETSPGFENFELIYGGAAGDAVQVLYREYAPNDLARPAFSQQLVYSHSAKRFRYRDFEIEFREADNEHIVYTVVSDGTRK